MSRLTDAIAAERREKGTTMQTMTQDAKLVARGRHLSWQCPCCNRTLGEVYDDRVTVKAGERMLIFPVDAPVIQLCPRCGSTSTLRKDDVA